MNTLTPGAVLASFFVIGYSCVEYSKNCGYGRTRGSVIKTYLASFVRVSGKTFTRHAQCQKIGQCQIIEK